MNSYIGDEFVNGMKTRCEVKLEPDDWRENITEESEEMERLHDELNEPKVEAAECGESDAECAVMERHVVYIKEEVDVSSPRNVSEVSEGEDSGCSDDSQSASREIRRRKRSAPEKWKQNVRKQKRNSYEEYVSTSGRIVPGKEYIEPSCNDKCFLNIGNREALFERFKSLGSYDKQNLYLSNFMEISKKSRKVPDAERKRSRTQFKYRLCENGVARPLCVKAFRTMFQISRKRLMKVQKSVQAADPSCLMDRRGKHVKKCISQEKRDEVHDHIKAFPSHCSQLSSALNLSKMYKLYKQRVDNPVKAWVYRYIFLHDFNLTFGASEIAAADLQET